MNANLGASTGTQGQAVLAGSSPAVRTMSRTILMTRTFLWLMALAAVAVTGCRPHYEVTLNNATKISAFSKPKRVEGFYVFKGVNGEEVRVFAGRVQMIERK